MSKISESRWKWAKEQITKLQEKSESQDKQLKLLFKLTKETKKEFDPCEEYNKLGEQTQESFRALAFNLLGAGISAANATKLFDWYINFIDSHKDDQLGL